MEKLIENNAKIIKNNGKIVDFPKIIGVTGKSGSGKSTFSSMLAEKLECEVLSLDKISHFSLENSEILAKIRQTFGNSAFFEGKLNRKELGKLAFSNPEKLEFLNAICLEFMYDFLDKKLSVSNSKFIIFDYALLPMMKYFKTAFFNILFVCDDKVRLERVVKREGITEEYFKKRDAHSPTYSEADFDEIVVTTALKQTDFEALAEKIAKKIQTKFNKQ